RYEFLTERARMLVETVKKARAKTGDE
ncbi:MAG: hypothetical protein U9Q23_02790, partial [Candidatus Bipolaricaulota bacterium]|nr:hypothetical protein [Candidatus Bipolaricaulota bacterium]